MEEKVVSDFLKSIGPWRNHVVIGGGYALIIFNLYLANKQERNPPVGTHDVDSLLPRRVPLASQKNIAKHLIEAGFRQFYRDFQDPATEAFVKTINGSEVEVEFLTDDAARFNKDKNVVIAGVVAQPLRYLKLSLENTVEFKTFSGEMGRVVAPQAWIFHKGLTFPKRSNKSKIYKDLYGIWYAGSQLHGFSEQAVNQLKVLSKQSPKWFAAFQENLDKWVENATPADWSRLEAQDPFGGLKKPSFKRLVEALVTKN